MTINRYFFMRLTVITNYFKFYYKKFVAIAILAVTLKNIRN